MADLDRIAAELYDDARSLQTSSVPMTVYVERSGANCIAPRGAADRWWLALDLDERNTASLDVLRDALYDAAREAGA
jgi:hypothetical protein